MNETLISGLLGAVMGGASSMEKSLAEEEAARRKEEEEKRREERAFTLAERKAEAEQSRKKALEEAERNRVAGMMGPETRITPGASPMEPEGVVESQIPIEERLQAGMQKAMSQGDPKAAKAFLEQYQGLEEIKRKASEEARKQEEFARGPKPERLTGEAATIDFLARQTYKGPVDEKGKPEPAAFARHMADVSESFIGKKTYIRPEREPGVSGPKPMTQDQIDKAETRLSAVVDKLGFSKGIADKTPQKDPEKRAILNSLLLQMRNDAIKKDPEKDPYAFFKTDLNEVENKLNSEFEKVNRKAREIASQKFDEFRGTKEKPGNPDAIADPFLKQLAKQKDFSKDIYLNEAAKKYWQEAMDFYSGRSSSRDGFSMRRIN